MLRLGASRAISSGPCPLYYATATTVRETPEGLFAVWRENDGRVYYGILGETPRVLSLPTDPIDEIPTDLADGHQWPIAALTRGLVPVVASPDGPHNATWIQVGEEEPIKLASSWDLCSSRDWIVGGQMWNRDREGGEDAVAIQLNLGAPRFRELVNARYGLPTWADQPGNEFAKRHLVNGLLLWSERTTFRHAGQPARICMDLYGGSLELGSLMPLDVGRTQPTPVDLQSPHFRLICGPVDQWSAVGMDVRGDVIAVPLIRWTQGGSMVGGYPNADTPGEWRLDILVRDPIEGWQIRHHSRYVWGTNSWLNQRPRVVLGAGSTMHLLWAPPLGCWTSTDLGRTWGPFVELPIAGQPVRGFATQREPNAVHLVYQTQDYRLWCARVEDV